MLVRAMEEKDVEAVVELENQLFATPWTSEDFLMEINHHDFSSILLLEDNNQIIGYIGLWYLGDQVQITTLGVDRDYQGQGLAKILMNKVIEIARHLGCNNVNLEVRVSNIRAISLYTSFGFVTKAIRKGYYQDNHEDAYLMIKEMEV